MKFFIQLVFLLILTLLPIICNARLNATEQANVLAACKTVWVPSVCNNLLICESVAEVVATTTNLVLKCQQQMGDLFKLLVEAVGIVFDGMLTGKLVAQIVPEVWESLMEMVEYIASRACINTVALNYRSILAIAEIDCY